MELSARVMVQRKDVETTIREVNELAASSLELLSRSRKSLESFGDHHNRMLASVDNSRALLARLVSS